MNTIGYICSLAFVCFFSVVSSSCTPAAPIAPSKAGRILYQWYPDTGGGDVSVAINLTEQVATVSRGAKEIGWAFVATGKEGHGTPSGTHYVTEKIEDKHSNLYGWIEDEAGQVINGDASPGDYVPPGAVYKAAPLPYWMRLTSSGVGMHIGNIPQPGETASHGCIRMPEKFMPTLFGKAKVGMKVVISR